MPIIDYRLFATGRPLVLTDTDGGRPSGLMDDIVALPGGGSIALYSGGSSSGFPDFERVEGSDYARIQRYGADGEAAGPPVDLAADQAGHQLRPQLILLPNGDVLAAWEERADATGGEDAIRVRRFDGDLNPVGETLSPLDGLLEAPRSVRLVLDEAAGEVVVLAREGGENDTGGLAYARIALDGLSVAATGTIDVPYDGDPPAAAIGADGALVLITDTPDGITVFKDGEEGGTLFDQGNRTYQAELVALPDGGYVASYIDVNDNGFENARVVFLDADGVPEDDGTLLAASRPDQVFRLPEHATRDVNLDVLPSGHVVIVHLASFRLTGGDLPVVNVFAPDGERVLRDLVLDDAGTYFNVVADVADGRPTVTYYDSDARQIISQTIDVNRQTLADDSGERLIGDGLSDDLIGGDGDDTVFAFGGDDIALGFGGDDEIDAGAGDDYLRGDDGADLLIGGAGDDVLYGDGAVGA